MTAPGLLARLSAATEGNRELSAEQLEELDALRLTNDAIGGPSFLRRSFYRDPVVGPLVRCGFIAWGQPPEGFRPSQYAGVTITDKGRAALRARGIT